MSKVLTIGAGGLRKGRSYLPKVLFGMMNASGTKPDCDLVAQEVGKDKIRTAQIDTENISQLVVLALMQDYQSSLVFHKELPCQSRSYEERITTTLGGGFDTDFTFTLARFAKRELFDEKRYLISTGSNNENHWKVVSLFLFPEININEISGKVKRLKNVDKGETDSAKEQQDLTHYEELASLTYNPPSLEFTRFWMSFGEVFLIHISVIPKLSMACGSPVSFKEVKAPPLLLIEEDFSDSGKSEENYYIWNSRSSQLLSEETETHGVFYTTNLSALVREEDFRCIEKPRGYVLLITEGYLNSFFRAWTPYVLPWQNEANGNLEGARWI